MIPFKKGVKIITAIRHEKDGKVFYKEQRLSRALKDFTRWINAVHPNDEKGASAEMRIYEEKGFPEWDIFRDEFQNWKKGEKSRKAKDSRSKRKKPKRKRARRREEEARRFEQNKDVILPLTSEAIEKGIIQPPA